MAAVWKLMTLVAILLMPIGMQSAVAAPAAQHHAAMPMQHCPEQAPTHHGKAGFVECTMACSAALPAAEARPDEPLIIVGVPNLPDVAERLNGLHPDPATPPPKPS